MGLDDQQVGQWCRRPTRLQLSLAVVEPHTEFFGTSYSVAAKTWTPSCGASRPPLGGQSHQQRLSDELLECPGMKNLSHDVEVVGVQPRDTRHSQPTSK
jgi:hypothetical protein